MLEFDEEVLKLFHVQVVGSDFCHYLPATHQLSEVALQRREDTPRVFVDYLVLGVVESIIGLGAVASHEGGDQGADEDEQDEGDHFGLDPAPALFVELFFVEVLTVADYHADFCNYYRCSNFSNKAQPAFKMRGQIETPREVLQGHLQNFRLEPIGRFSDFTSKT